MPVVLHRSTVGDMVDRDVDTALARSFLAELPAELAGELRVQGGSQGPGHTSGSVAVHIPGADAPLIGDTMTTRNVLTGATGPKPAPFTLGPGQALASLAARRPHLARCSIPRISFGQEFFPQPYLADPRSD